MPYAKHPTHGLLIGLLIVGFIFLSTTTTKEAAATANDGTDQQASIGLYPEPMTVGRLSRDNTLDLVVVRGTTLKVIPDIEKDFSAPGATYQLREKPGAIAIEKFEDDKYPDIVIRNDLDDSLTVLTNNGHGSFTVGETVVNRKWLKP